MRNWRGMKRKGKRREEKKKDVFVQTTEIEKKNKRMQTKESRTGVSDSTMEVHEQEQEAFPSSGEVQQRLKAFENELGLFAQHWIGDLACGIARRPREGRGGRSGHQRGRPPTGGGT